MEKNYYYAGFRRRFIAIMIDTVILVPCLLLASALGLKGNLFEIFICWVYFAGMESSPMQGTIGKMVTGIKVIDLQGNRISLIVASVRYIVKGFSSILFFVGYLMVIFSPKKQGLHDVLSGCLVVWGG